MPDSTISVEENMSPRPGLTRNILAILISLAISAVSAAFLVYLTYIGLFTMFASEAVIEDVLMESPYLILAAAVIYLPYPLVSVGICVITAEVIHSRLGNRGSLLIIPAGVLAAFLFSTVDFLFYQGSTIGIAAAVTAIIAYWLFAWFPSLK